MWVSCRRELWIWASLGAVWTEPRSGFRLDTSPCLPGPGSHPVCSPWGAPRAGPHRQATLGPLLCPLLRRALAWVLLAFATPAVYRQGLQAGWQEAFQFYVRAISPPSWRFWWGRGSSSRLPMAALLLRREKSKIVSLRSLPPFPDATSSWSQQVGVTPGLQGLPAPCFCTLPGEACSAPAWRVDVLTSRPWQTRT